MKHPVWDASEAARDTVKCSRISKIPTCSAKKYWHLIFFHTIWHFFAKIDIFSQILSFFHTFWHFFALQVDILIHLKGFIAAPEASKSPPEPIKWSKISTCSTKNINFCEQCQFLWKNSLLWKLWKAAETGPLKWSKISSCSRFFFKFCKTNVHVCESVHFCEKMSKFVKKCQKLWKIVKFCDKIPVFDALSPQRPRPVAEGSQRTQSPRLGCFRCGNKSPQMD